MLTREEGFEAFEKGRQPETWWIARHHVWAVRNRAYVQPVGQLDLVGRVAYQARKAAG